MRRKLRAAAALFVVLAFCLDSPARPQGEGAKTRNSLAQRKARPKAQPKKSPRGAALGQRLTAAVTLRNFEFRPKTITVKPGTVVTWTNEAGSHNVTADDGSFSSDTLSAGQTFSHKFDRRGTYRYHCSFHGGAGGHDMAGTVVVRP